MRGARVERPRRCRNRHPAVLGDLREGRQVAPFPGFCKPLLQTIASSWSWLVCLSTKSHTRASCHEATGKLRDPAGHRSGTVADDLDGDPAARGLSEPPKYKRAPAGSQVHAFADAVTMSSSPPAPAATTSSSKPVFPPSSPTPLLCRAKTSATGVDCGFAVRQGLGLRAFERGVPAPVSSVSGRRRGQGERLR